MTLSDTKIGTRLAATTGLLLVLMLLLTAVGSWLLRDFSRDTDMILHDAIPKERLVIEWRESIEVDTARTMLLLTTDDAALRETVEADMRGNAERLSKVQQELTQGVSSTDGKALLAQALARRGEYGDISKGLLAAKAAGELDTLTTGRARLMEAFGAYDASLGKLAQFQREKTASLDAQIDADNRRGQMVLGGLCFAALVIAITCTVTVRRSITVPLQRAMTLAQEVAAGRLSSHQAACSRDETGQLLAALYKMNGDLFRIVGAVRDSSATIVTASDEIAHGNQDLSARTEQQAGSLEETASSMEELTSTVQQNAGNVREADQLASAASSVAARGSAVVAQVVETMGSINASAGKINDIIGVIDGIAFQTNILALNAAVEAARAGEQGRGFAVVASEVRNLAQRSASAAKEIKQLIETSARDVAAGTDLVGKAGDTMHEIQSSVERVTNIMRDISQANGEQEAGIAQINQAITQMDSVTQQNAALVEEAAAASEALRDQAAHLGRLVGTFELEEVRQGQPAAPSAARVRQPVPQVRMALA